MGYWRVPSNIPLNGLMSGNMYDFEATTGFGAIVSVKGFHCHGVDCCSTGQNELRAKFAWLVASMCPVPFLPFDGLRMKCLIRTPQSVHVAMQELEFSLSARF